jgi:hypothetical protein
LTFARSALISLLCLAESRGRNVLVGIFLIATKATAGAYHFPDGEGMRYSDYPAVKACLRDHPKNSGQTNTERNIYCINKVVTERVERERDQQK